MTGWMVSTYVRPKKHDRGNLPETRHNLSRTQSPPGFDTVDVVRRPPNAHAALSHATTLERNQETEPLEERSIRLDPPIRAHTAERCGWCGLPVRRHGPEALARCEAALRAALERRRTGPLRIRDTTRPGGGSPW